MYSYRELKIILSFCDKLFLILTQLLKYIHTFVSSFFTVYFLISRVKLKLKRNYIYKKCTYKISNHFYCPQLCWQKTILKKKKKYYKNLIIQ